MNPLKLLNPSYLFDPTPGYYFMYFWPLVVIFGLTYFGSLFLKRKYKNLPEIIPERIRQFSLIGLILTFFRDQNIPFLGMRAWLVLFFLLVFVYAVWSRFAFNKSAKEKVKTSHRVEIKDKYLPQPKKKKKKKRK